MPVQLKRSAVAGKAPTTGNLALGELAVNTHDGRIYLKTDDGAGGVAVAEIRNWADVQAALSGHGHDIGDVSGLQAALDGKAAASHGHPITAITNLQTTLDGKASKTGAETLSNKTLASPKLTGSVEEQVHAITGTTPALDPANGTVQTWTLTGNSTPTANIPNGQSMTLMVADGTSAFTIDWSGAVGSWIGGSAPALPETGYAVITLWAVGGVVYGAGMGDTA